MIISWMILFCMIESTLVMMMSVRRRVRSQSITPFTREQYAESKVIDCCYYTISFDLTKHLLGTSSCWSDFLAFGRLLLRLWTFCTGIQNSSRLFKDSDQCTIALPWPIKRKWTGQLVLLSIKKCSRFCFPSIKGKRYFVPLFLKNPETPLHNLG